MRNSVEMVHIQIFFVGQCVYCSKRNEQLVKDYGRMHFKEFELQMDEDSYPLRPIRCTRCGAEYSPVSILSKTAEGEVISDSPISETIQEDPAVVEGQQNRLEFFKGHEEEFWQAFCLFAAEDWKAAVGELSRSEIEGAYIKLGVTAIGVKTEQQARRDAANRFTTFDTRSEFWRTANHQFIYDEMLDIGPLGWVLDLEVKMFGARRVRFVVMHMPMSDALEPTRTKHIATLFRRDKGDNAFLFRRIAQQQDEISRLRGRLREQQRQVEAKTYEVAAAEYKLSEAYKEVRSIRDSKGVTTRSPDDIRKISELKSFASDLLRQLREVEGTPEEEPTEITEELVEQTENDRQPNLSLLSGKTVSIIGGWRKGGAGNYPCEILTHDGRKHDPDFIQVLDDADIIVVLTRFVSHASMWEAKAWAIDQDKPILFLPEINMTRILNAVSLYIQ
ncbi:DUF2325 domain-containing protein [Paenibacillaceae bacterium]|nr:DUF2325 domain-containing protein [Paenibacillaceae bacterium]